MSTAASEVLSRSDRKELHVLCIGWRVEREKRGGEQAKGGGFGSLTAALQIDIAAPVLGGRRCPSDEGPFAPVHAWKLSL